MKKHISIIVASLFIFTACGDYQKILKSTDPEMKYDKAVEFFEAKKYDKAITLFDDISSFYRNTDRAELIINYVAKANMGKKDYFEASERYKTYIKSFPQGKYLEEAKFMIAYCDYLDSPDVRLDQSSTIQAIASFQDFIDMFPNSERTKQAETYLKELNDKLAQKELLNAQLYYNLGLYLGNNYLSAVITAQNALKKYPSTKWREDLMIIILKSKYQEAIYSEDNLKSERYQSAMDEVYTYKNEYPDGKFVKQADEIMKNCQKNMPETNQ